MMWFDKIFKLLKVDNNMPFKSIIIITFSLFNLFWIFFLTDWCLNGNVISKRLKIK